MDRDDKMMTDSEQRDPNDIPPLVRVYSNWGLAVRAVILAAIITGAVYFATAAFLDWAYRPLPG